ncbi:citrate lyase subunit beta/citryl-CoA lyase [Bacilli bacterium PM5-3]|nr:citrate lyase subunit beta/citryl-CoA lyase [Bacilli bacterium PM5-3]MDH6603207.1 citrate lyase subunit beta/citryl-CoA lyase [Bacilli bacterium PM5-9]
MEPYIRSALFIPANNPGMVQSSDLLEADAIIFDLEDAISIANKDSARYLLEEAFNFFDKSDVIRIVRINPMDSPFFYDDIEVVKKFDVDYIMLAKASQESVKELAARLKGTDIKIVVLIESAYGVFDLANIIKASDLVEGMLFGAEDYALDMQIVRTKESNEILVARQNIATTCKALNIFSLDTPFTDVEDFEMLVCDTKKARNFGFSGKACINPRQVTYVNDVFSPSMDEIVYAQEVIEAAKKAEADGLGVFSLNGKMVDAPIINRAKLTLENAKKAGIKYE